MTVHVQSKSFAVTDAIREWSVEKVANIWKKGLRVVDVSVFLENISRKKNDFTSTVARVIVSLPGKKIAVERMAGDVYQAIAEAAQSAERAVRKHKEKLFDRRLLESVGLR